MFDKITDIFFGSMYRAIFWFFIIFFCGFRIFYIPTESMSPTIPERTLIIGTVFNYGINTPYIPAMNNYIWTDHPKIVENKNQPDYGDIVLFRHPDSLETILIKRVFGKPGDTIKVNTNGIYLKKHGTSDFILDPYLSNSNIKYDINASHTYNEINKFKKEHALSTSKEYVFELNDSYFMVGDNRNHSFDSRFFGPVKSELLFAKMLIKLF